MEGEFEDMDVEILWAAEYFLGVTLACDDDYFRVHKIIQISCSELFHIVSLNNWALGLEKPIKMSKNFKAENSSLQILRLKIDEQTLKNM